MKNQYLSSNIKALEEKVYYYYYYTGLLICIKSSNGVRWCTVQVVKNARNCSCVRLRVKCALYFLM